MKHHIITFVCPARSHILYRALRYFNLTQELDEGRKLIYIYIYIYTVYKITEPHEEEAKARYGLQRHVRRIRIYIYIRILKFAFN
jgi:hypothetical protein